MFFLLIFGLATHVKRLGDGRERTCPRCHNTTTWARLRESTQLTLFFIPVLRWDRRELDACPICGERVELPAGASRRAIRAATA
jgi:endogenous inhibitor of DNA gyrase (YacG/DUF329 family)